MALSFLYRLVRRAIELLRVRRLGGLEKDVENLSCRGPSGNGGNGTTSLLIAECQRGWIPYLLERADDVWFTHRGWSGSRLYCPEPPSAYYYRLIGS